MRSFRPNSNLEQTNPSEHKRYSHCQKPNLTAEYQQIMTFYRVHEMFLESSIRGYHAIKEEEVFIGEVMICEQENDNEYDEYAVSVCARKVAKWSVMSQLNCQRFSPFF